MALLELGRDRLQSGASVAERKLCPLRKVAVLGGSMACEVATRELSERAIAVDLGTLTKPVSSKNESMVASDHRPTDDQPVESRPKQQVRRRVADRRYPLLLEDRTDLATRQWPVVSERFYDRSDRAARGRFAHALLPEATIAVGAQLRRGQRVQQRLVLSGNQVQRSTVDPGDDQRALTRQCVIDCRRAPAGRAGSERKASTTRILALHR